MRRRDDAWETHGEEEPGPEGTEVGCWQGRGEEGEDYDDSEYRDGGEVDETGVRVAVEGVVDRGEEGRDDHDGDPGVVKPPEEEVELLRVGREEVGQGAEGQAGHGSGEKHKPGPVRNIGGVILAHL